MGILNRLFGNNESVSNEIVLEDEKLIAIWFEFNATYSKKVELAPKLKEDNSSNTALVIKALIGKELVSISGEEHLSEDIVKDIKKLKHNAIIKRVKRLNESLNYEQSRYEYAHKLLEVLFQTLRRQLHIFNNMTKQNVYVVDLNQVRLFYKELVVEKEIIDNSQSSVGKFHEAFVALAKGQKIIKRLSDHEKQMETAMLKQLIPIGNNQVTEGMLAEWAGEVFSTVMYFLDDLVAAQDGFLTYKGRKFLRHLCPDMEFVNSAEFEHVVREYIPKNASNKITPQMFTAFLSAFREWYNHERKQISV